MGTDYLLPLCLMNRLIRLTSPTLNYLIGAGAIVFYVDVYIYVLPSTDQVAVSLLCHVSGECRVSSC